MKKILLLLLSFLTLSKTSYSLIYIIPSGTERTTTLTLPDFGDEAIIEEFGIISVNGVVGINLTNSSQKALNQGYIFTTGNNAAGIASSGGLNALITNNGLITTSGNTSAGITNADNNSTLINNNQITTAGSSSNGIENRISNNVLVLNNGLITTTGSGSFGLYNDGASSNITNRGQIVTTGTGSFGIFNFNNSNTKLTNSGIISVQGDSIAGIINILGSNIVITNNGYISVTGALSEGILSSTSSNTVVINSGTIISKQLNAINVDGLNPSLILLRGSNLQGGVQFTTDPVKLTVERGLNLALTLTPASLGFGALSIDAPFVISGKTIGVIDPTGLGLQADVVADISDTILNGIYRHRTAFGCQCTPCGCEIWVEGIGSYRKRGHYNNMGYDNSQGGFIIGMNNPFCNGNIGLFGAVSFGKAEVDERTQKADITNYIGGITYENIWCNTFFGFACALGYVDWCNERFVMNNLVDGGVERAKFDKGAFFVSPEFTIAHYFSSLSRAPILSFTCRYAGCFFEDYHEQGSLTNLSVKDREIDLITTRLEFSVPFTDTCGGCCWSIEPYLGGYGRFQVGGKDVHGVLLDQAISFNVGNPQNLGAFLLGCRGIQSFRRVNLFLNFEVSFDNARSTRLLGEGGVGVHF